MKLLQWIRGLFNTKSDTNYSKQVLTDKQLEVIELLDLFLVQHRGPMGKNFLVKSFKIPLYMQHETPEYLVNGLFKASSTLSGYYMPRSLALIVDPDGTWSFYYGIHQQTSPSNEITNELFLAAMNRTNDART